MHAEMRAEQMESEMEMSQAYPQEVGFFKRLGIIDWLYAALLMSGALFALLKYGTYMDGYEKGILVLTAPTFT